VLAVYCTYSTCCLFFILFISNVFCLLVNSTYSLLWTVSTVTAVRYVYKDAVLLVYSSCRRCVFFSACCHLFLLVLSTCVYSARCWVRYQTYTIKCDYMFYWLPTVFTLNSMQAWCRCFFNYLLPNVFTLHAINCLDSACYRMFFLLPAEDLTLSTELCFQCRLLTLL
jgi:hypothetical protein